MITNIDLASLRFDEPQFLWLLLAPAALLLLWVWQIAARRGDVRRFAERRMLPVRERFQFFGGLLFWLCLILATASAIIALSRPVARVSVVRTAGIDLVILQDGSTSMRVSDVAGDRWQRSMKFLRQLGESFSWKDDRIALALFARVATPQMRLTKDPNTYFFFLDHLGRQSPFRLENDTSWDTNTELGIYWGLRLIDKDEEIHGKSPNAKAFVLISDGQTWSGEVQRSLALVRSRHIPVYAIGVGTTGGGLIPLPPPTPAHPTNEPVFAVLDRSSLDTIARAAGGEYFELDRETDRQIANRIIQETRRRASYQGVEEGIQALYWRFLFLAACFVCLGALFVHERAELWIQLVSAAALLFAVSRVIR